VVEHSFHGSLPSHSRNLHSATKGLVSLITGAAIEDGFLPALDTPIGELLTEATGTPVGDVTLEQLLALSGGVTEGDERHLVRDAVASPLVSEPGTAWTYGNASVELVALALERAVAGGLCRYAHRVLAPLGITVDHWHLNEQGNVTGRAYAFLTARELARIGQLVLHDGRWAGEQVIPESFLRAMLEPRFDIDGGPYDHSAGCAGTTPRVGTGLLWRITAVGGHAAWMTSGYGGQYLVVVPDLDLVMVVQHDTFHDATMELQRHVSPLAFLESFVLPGLPPGERGAPACTTDLAIGPLDGETWRTVAPGPGDDLLPDWSPDGTRLAFTSFRDLAPEIYVVDADGGGLTRLSRDWAVDVWPRWSPDGTRLLFLSERAATSMSGLPRFDAYVLDLRTGQATMVSPGLGDVWAADWTPDGSIATVRSDGEDGLGELWLGDKHGMNATLLPGPRVGWPAWSPDGTRVAVATAFVADEPDPVVLGVLDPTTGEVVDLGRATDVPTWSPDGRVVTTVSTDNGPRMVFLEPDTGARTLGPPVDRGHLSPDGTLVAWPRSPESTR
jgi:hypothetical protein